MERGAKHDDEHDQPDGKDQRDNQPPGKAAARWA